MADALESLAVTVERYATAPEGSWWEDGEEQEVAVVRAAQLLTLRSLAGGEATDAFREVCLAHRLERVLVQAVVRWRRQGFWRHAQARKRESAAGRGATLRDHYRRWLGLWHRRWQDRAIRCALQALDLQRERTRSLVEEMEQPHGWTGTTGSSELFSSYGRAMAVDLEDDDVESACVRLLARTVATFRWHRGAWGGTEDAEEEEELERPRLPSAMEVLCEVLLAAALDATWENRLLLSSLGLDDADVSEADAAVPASPRAPVSASCGRSRVAGSGAEIVTTDHPMMRRERHAASSLRRSVSCVDEFDAAPLSMSLCSASGTASGSSSGRSSLGAGAPPRTRPTVATTDGPFLRPNAASANDGPLGTEADGRRRLAESVRCRLVRHSVMSTIATDDALSRAVSVNAAAAPKDTHNEMQPSGSETAAMLSPCDDIHLDRTMPPLPRALIEAPSGAIAATEFSVIASYLSAAFALVAVAQATVTQSEGGGSTPDLRSLAPTLVDLLRLRSVTEAFALILRNVFVEPSSVCTLFPSGIVERAIEVIRALVAPRHAEARQLLTDANVGAYLAVAARRYSELGDVALATRATDAACVLAGRSADQFGFLVAHDWERGGPSRGASPKTLPSRRRRPGTPHTTGKGRTWSTLRRPATPRHRRVHSYGMDAATVAPEVPEASAGTEQTPAPPPPPMMMMMVMMKRWQRHGRRQWSAGTESEVLAREGAATEVNGADASPSSSSSPTSSPTSAWRPTALTPSPGRRAIRHLRSLSRTPLCPVFASAAASPHALSRSNAEALMAWQSVLPSLMLAPSGMAGTNDDRSPARRLSATATADTAERVRQLLQRYGVPEELRRRLWPAFLEIHDQRAACPPNYYRRLLAVAVSAVDSRRPRLSPQESGTAAAAALTLDGAADVGHERLLAPDPSGAVPAAAPRPVLPLARETLEAIDKDVTRTLCNHRLFWRGGAALGLGALRNVLRAYACADPEIGYCQGMSSIAGALYIYSGGSEERCFYMFLQFMHGRLRFRRMFLPGFRCLRRLVGEFEVLLRRKLPRLARHLEAEGVLPMMYADKWYLTALLYNFPFPVVSRVWDGMLYAGHTKLLHRATLAVMVRAERAGRLSRSVHFEELLVYLQRGFAEDEAIFADVDAFMHDTHHRFAFTRAELRAMRIDEDTGRPAGVVDAKGNAGRAGVVPGWLRLSWGRRQAASRQPAEDAVSDKPVQYTENGRGRRPRPRRRRGLLLACFGCAHPDV